MVYLNPSSVRFESTDNVTYELICFFFETECIPQTADENIHKQCRATDNV